MNIFCKTESCRYNNDWQCLYADKIIIREDAVCERYSPARRLTLSWRDEEGEE